MSWLVEILHTLRDDLLRATSALERGDEISCLRELEQAAEKIRSAVEEIRAA